MRNEGIGSWPARRARMSPARPAFVFDDRKTSYADFHTRVGKLANQLLSVGVEKGDRVAYLGPNHQAFAESLFATQLVGGIFVPLNFRLAAPEVDYMLGHSGAVVLVYGPECADPVATLESRAGMHVVVALTDPAVGEVRYEAWLQDGDSAPIDVPVATGDPALILYTSGTTGRPKGAVLTHESLVWNCFNIMLGVDITADEKTLISAPLFHVAALDQTLLPTFMKGGCSIIMPSWNVDDCYDLIERHGVTWMFGVTAMFADFARSPRWLDADLSSLRNLMSGGAPIPEALIGTYQQRGLVFCQGYGLTETAPGATFLEAGESITKAGSAGVPVFFADVRVVGLDGADVAAGERGEVLVKGPNVTSGYWQDPHATAAAFSEDGWFRSGDVGTLDDDGYLYIVDRMKDMYISGGENVYPAEVEAVLFEHPAIAECAVIGVPDGKWGEVGHAFVVTEGTAVSADEVREFLATRMAKYKVPVRVDVVDALPRTGSGKVRKEKLRENAVDVGPA